MRRTKVEELSRQTTMRRAASDMDLAAAIFKTKDLPVMAWRADEAARLLREAASHITALEYQLYGRQEAAE